MTSTTGLHETLEPKAFEAAHHAYETFGQTGHLKAARLSDEAMAAIVAAYLAARPPERLSASMAGPVPEGWRLITDDPPLDRKFLGASIDALRADGTRRPDNIWLIRGRHIDYAGGPAHWTWNEAEGGRYGIRLTHWHELPPLPAAAAPAPALPEGKPVADEEPIAWLVYVAFPPDGGEARYEVAEPGEDNAFPVYASPVQVEREAVIEAARAVVEAYDDCSGAEPSQSVLDRAIDDDLRRSLSRTQP